MPDLLALSRTCVRCVEACSFSAVATEAGTSQPTISRQMAALAQHPGCRLVRRTTRSLTPTDEGRTYDGLALAALDSAEQAEASVYRRRGRKAGRLRLACAGVFGRLRVIPRLGAFMAHYPDLDVDLVLQDRTTDLVVEGVDVALRVGRSEDAALVGRRIGQSQRVVVASPACLADHGRPAAPSGLRQHRCILYRGLTSGPTWHFAGAADR